MSAIEGTKTRAIQEARGLLQDFGFNGFSFQHIADALGIKKPSLYDHFKSKEALGLDLLEDYVRTFGVWMKTIEIFEPKDKIGAIFELFYQYANDHRKVCPVSALTADYNSLPPSMRKVLAKMMKTRNDWLKSVIEEGQAKKVFRTDLSSGALADLVQSIGLGAQLISRGTNDPEKLRQFKTQVYQILEGGKS
jgi:TetR/AcrR family transcriptional repressor of nem operon